MRFVRIGGLAEQRQRSLDVRLLSVYLLFASANLQVSDSQCGLSLYIYTLCIYTQCVYIYIRIYVYMFLTTHICMCLCLIFIYIYTHTPQAFAQEAPSLKDMKDTLTSGLPSQCKALSEQSGRRTLCQALNEDRASEPQQRHHS